MSHLGKEHDATTDFNGDGRSDLLLISSSVTYSQWLAQPNGSFAKSPAAPLDKRAWLESIADFNGDGRDDLLFREGNGYVISAYLAQADGTFVAGPVYQIPYPATGSPYEYWYVRTTGDFNGDGRDDILWGDLAGSVSEWLGQADGSFAWNPASTYVVAQDLTDANMRTGDFNGDGRDDLLWRDYFGVLAQWLGQEDGTFAWNPAAIYEVDGFGDIYVGDFDGDTRDDILWWSSGTGTVSEWLAQPDGSFAWNERATYQTPSSWWLLGTGDFDGDGRDDVLWKDQLYVVGQWQGQEDGMFDWSRDAVFIVPPVDWVPHLPPYF